jgi:DNA-binding NtrC family response regulator
MADPYPEYPILMVDDEEAILSSQDVILRSAEITNTLLCSDPGAVMPIIRGRPIEMVLLDLSMPRISGMQLLAEIHEEFPELPVVVVTGSNEIDSAVACMRAGAFDYVVKAAEESRFLGGVKRAIEVRTLRRRYAELRSHFVDDVVDHPEAFEDIVTRSRRMRALFVYIGSIARTREAVLIRGETGAGKELFGRAVHRASGVPGKLVTVNTGGLDDAMLGDALFGHRKGAYTGAAESRDGLVRQASGGTLFLDEIGDLSLQSQIKLLRILETREYYPLGSDLAHSADCRFVVATSADMDALVASGRFRRDLYYRLATHEVRIPPLRERKEDLPLLLDHFLDRACADLSRDRVAVSPQIYAYLESYDFPGNVRELRSMVYDAVGSHSSRILPIAAFPKLRARPVEPTPEADGVVYPSCLPSLKAAVRLLVEEALKRSGGNQALAANLVGITPQAMSRRLKRSRSEEAP